MLDCPVRPGHAVVLDSLHRAFLGHDVLFFCDDRSRKAFVSNPLKYCRTLTDPVTLERFDVTSRSPRAVFKGRPYYFRSDSTWRAFSATPDSFASRRGM